MHAPAFAAQSFSTIVFNFASWQAWPAPFLFLWCAVSCRPYIPRRGETQPNAMHKRLLLPSTSTLIVNRINAKTLSSLSALRVVRVVCFVPQQLVTLTVNSGTDLVLHLGPTTCSSGSSSNDGDDDNSESTSDSPGSGSSLKGVRIVVKEGGKLFVGMAVDPLDMESATAGERVSTLTLEGAAQQVCADT